MVAANPAREKRTPSQSHSSGSYRETGMGGIERFRRDGWESFLQGLTHRIKPARVQCGNASRSRN